MGVLAKVDSWLESLGKKSDDQPTVLVQYGSTKSYTFRRMVLRDNFTLPSLPDQGRVIAVLRAARHFLMPDLTDEDFDNLRQMLVMCDDVILGGLKDPGNWVLPRGFSDLPFVKPRLDKGYPVEQILDYILTATRLYIWLYKDDESVSELIPHLIELEETFESLRTRVKGDDGSRDLDPVMSLSPNGGRYTP